MRFPLRSAIALGAAPFLMAATCTPRANQEVQKAFQDINSAAPPANISLISSAPPSCLTTNIIEVRVSHGLFNTLTVFQIPENTRVPQVFAPGAGAVDPKLAPFFVVTNAKDDPKTLVETADIQIQVPALKCGDSAVRANFIISDNAINKAFQSDPGKRIASIEVITKFVPAPILISGISQGQTECLYGTDFNWQAGCAGDVAFVDPSKGEDFDDFASNCHFAAKCKSDRRRLDRPGDFILEAKDQCGSTVVLSRLHWDQYPPGCPGAGPGPEQDCADNPGSCNTGDGD